MSSEARGIWMVSEGFISGCWGSQGAEDQREMPAPATQLSGDGQRAIVSGPCGQC